MSGLNEDRLKRGLKEWALNIKIKLFIKMFILYLFNISFYC